MTSLDPNKHKIRMAYILAASHSGSTLTAMLLGAHPQLSCVGELKLNHLGDPETYLCSCRRRVRECEFWCSVSSKMRELGTEFDVFDAGTDLFGNANRYEQRLLRPLVRGIWAETIRDLALGLSPGWRSKLVDMSRRNHLLAKVLLEQTGKEMIVDSSKIGIRLKYLLRIPELDIKVIWLVRDGRGVSLAYLNPGEFADASNQTMRGGGSGTTHEQSREIEVGAREWARCNEEAESIVATLPHSQWIRIHYEDVCSQTEETLDAMYRFLGVDPSKRELAFRTGDHHVIGNGMRLDSGNEIILDERWKSVLNEAQLNSYFKVAGAIHKRLGYES